MRIFLTMAFLTALAAKSASNGAPAEALTAFDSALKAEHANVATPAGEVFDKEIGKQFSERHTDTMNRCTQNVTDADLAGFDLLMKLGADGKVQEALIRPETKVATCLQKSVTNDAYKKPPRDGYWVRIGVTLTP